MRIYLTTIRHLQTSLLGASLCILAILPILIAFTPDIIDPSITALYAIAHGAVFFVMTIRPLADIVIGLPFLRPLVILRKGVGVFSASLVISFMLAKMIADPLTYLGGILELSYWSLNGYAILAHLADISALVLLITSNNLSKRLLGVWWKRIQRLSYVYFYASALYVYLSFGDSTVMYYMYVVTSLTLVAFIINILRKYERNTRVI